jgi:hypothetical protein
MPGVILLAADGGPAASGATQVGLLAAIRCRIWRLGSRPIPVGRVAAAEAAVGLVVAAYSILNRRTWRRRADYA